MTNVDLIQGVQVTGIPSNHKNIFFRISIERPSMNEWNLHIRDIRPSDQGVYMCQANTFPVQTKEVTLTVEGKLEGIILIFLGKGFKMMLFKIKRYLKIPHNT